jgi:NAD(P)-dependent dehydrogenase (short-subunit alcohol dehydrogenase family)
MQVLTSLHDYFLLTIKGGLGTATGLVLHLQGAQLALLYAPFEASREEEVLQAMYGAARKDISTYECDIISETSVARASKKISSETASSNAYPSILINAAGYVSVAPLQETSAEEAMKTLSYSRITAHPILLRIPSAPLTNRIRLHGTPRRHN